MQDDVDHAEYVVCWTHRRQNLFLRDTDWVPIRARYEYEASLVRPEFDPTVEMRNIGILRRAGCGFPPRRDFPVGVFRAMRISEQEPPDCFTVCGIPGGVFGLLGVRVEIEAQLARFAESSSVGFACHYSPELRGASVNTPKPPSRTRVTSASRHVAELVAHRATTAIHEAIGELEPEEMLAVTHDLRRRKLPHHALVVALCLVERSKTTDALNVLGGVYRDLRRYDESLDAYSRSLSLRRDARFNPYAFVGKAATLRHMDCPDDAWDALKFPLKHYPDDKYALDVRDAIIRDQRRAAGWINRAEELAVAEARDGSAWRTVPPSKLADLPPRGARR